MSPFSALSLPNGRTLRNRIAKAAMEENMADREHAPSEALLRLYEAWAEGGAGLLLSGNVMIDRRALTGPGGVVRESGPHLDRFRAWAQVGCNSIMPADRCLPAWAMHTCAPSAVPWEMGALSPMFGTPRAMTEAEIGEVIRRFAHSARLAECADFDGVQIHAAHGYLISQFLSPQSNRRRDRWGGSLENLARLLMETIPAVRSAVSPEFCVAVKLNSADFQRGGFDAEDAGHVLEMLNASPCMAGAS